MSHTAKPYKWVPYRFRGVWHIVVYNWPRYVAGLLVVLLLAPLTIACRVSPSAVAASWLAIGLISWWTVASLAASHWVYDRSTLPSLEWLDKALSARPQRWAAIHAGLDEFSEPLRKSLKSEPLAVLDIYDPEQMTEASIARARIAARSGDQGSNATVRHSALPLADRSCDAIFLILAAHELRTPSAKSALFAEVNRALNTAGEAVVIEHLRDWANFAAFGPGFLHFASRRAWLRAFSRGGLRERREFGITPFVRVFVLGASHEP